MAPDQSSSTSDEEQQRPPPLLALTLPPTQSLLIPFNSDRLTADRPPPPQVVPQRVVRRLPGGAPVSVTTRTLTIKWRPPVEQIMETFNTLIGTVACFEEYLTLPSHIDICYSHLENLWNYHTLESSTFHQIYYKPTLNQPIKHHTLYRFYHPPDDGGSHPCPHRTPYDLLSWGLRSSPQHVKGSRRLSSPFC